MTGASRGIGRAIATELARTHHVIGTYRGRPDAAEWLREETGCEIFRCDVSSRADREALLAFARERFESLDLLVNNAGMAPRERRDLLEATEESFDEADRHQPEGPALPHPAGGALDGGARRRAHRLRDFDFSLHGLGEPRRVLRLQGRPEHVRGALRRSGWRRWG